MGGAHKHKRLAALRFLCLTSASPPDAAHHDNSNHLATFSHFPPQVIPPSQSIATQTRPPLPSDNTRRRIPFLSSFFRTSEPVIPSAFGAQAQSRARARKFRHPAALGRLLFQPRPRSVAPVRSLLPTYHFNLPPRPVRSYTLSTTSFNPLP